MNFNCEIDDCNGKAIFECEHCGVRYCKECAGNSDYECDCEPLPKLVKIKKLRITKRNKL